MFEILISVIFGAVVAIITTIIVENLRRPRLIINIAKPTDNDYPQDHPAKHARFLCLEVKNKPLTKLTRWMSRNTAVQCHGTISYHHLDGQNICKRSMMTRWSESPEPTGFPIIHEGKTFFYLDLSKMTNKLDIPPGEIGRFDVAVRFDEESECYGWNNDSYFSQPIWRNPDWKLPPGRYLVKITIYSAGEKCVQVFRMIKRCSNKRFSY